MNRGPSNVNRVLRNVTMGPCNMIMGPWNANRGLRNVIRGPVI